MTVYRIARAEHADLSGEGARLFPGRWNTEGIPCVYASSSPSLAQLEVMVNSDDWTIFNRLKYVLLTIHVDESRLVKFTSKNLPDNWSSPIIIEATQWFGTVQLNKLRSVGFIVPSTVTPQEKNIILNPRAENFARYVRLISREPFRLDDRLAS